MPRRHPPKPVVYYARNRLTGERYFGFTTQPFGRRKSHHINGAKNGRITQPFAKAIVEHGEEAFEWGVIAEFKTREEAVEFERLLIKNLNPEYNATSGGKAYVPHTLSQEIKERLRRFALRDIARWRKHAAKGPAAMARAVVCLNTGRKFRSASAAARTYGLDKSTVIEVCQRQPRRRSAGGKVFRYTDDLDPSEKWEEIIHRSRSNGQNPYKGVYKHVSEGKHTGRWRVRIRVGKPYYSIGIFDTPEEARDARLKAYDDLKKGRRPKWLRDHTPREQQQTQTTVLGRPVTVAR